MEPLREHWTIATAVIFLKSSYHTTHSPISAYHVPNLDSLLYNRIDTSLSSEYCLVLMQWTNMGSNNICHK